MFYNFQRIFLALIFLSLIPSLVTAQTVRAKISVEPGKNLQPEYQELLAELPRELNEYINSFSWSNENPDILVQCELNIIVETVTTRGSDQIFRGQILVSSPSGENFYDRSVEFTYQRGQAMIHQRAIFDPLPSLIDYYIYVVMAGELDTYLLQGGTRFYNIAMNIANQGLVSNYPSGWRSRLEEVQLITDGDHVPLREAKFYYYECLYYIEAEPNPDQAQQLVTKVVDLLEKTYQRRPNSRVLKRFFDAHYQEFCNLFVYNSDKSSLQKLANIDDRHREVYESCIETSTF